MSVYVLTYKGALICVSVSLTHSLAVSLTLFLSRKRKAGVIVAIVINN